MQISATIQNFAFSPNPITIALGSTVTWTNLDGAPHTVTADDGSWGSSTLGHGGAYSHVFTSPGTYTYYCAIHPSMKGTVVVTPPPGQRQREGKAYPGRESAQQSGARDADGYAHLAAGGAGQELAQSEQIGIGLRVHPFAVRHVGVMEVPQVRNRARG
jgi:hypothetical protein